MSHEGTRVALVTGASYGLGAAAAVALAESGFDIALTEVPGVDLSKTVARIQALRRRALPLELDLRSQESIDAAVDTTLKEFGQLDLLVNNASAIVAKPAIQITRAELLTVIDVNVAGTFLLTQRVGRYMLENKRPGTIVSVSSTHGIIGEKLMSVYGMAKAAIIQMTRMLAVEWAESGIRVNAVAPGRMLTESPPRLASTNDPKHVELRTQQTPTRRLVTVEEVAAAICYLASPLARSVTGHVLSVDGGLTIA
jgi:NAD(P)-dependent dehydrogenase (short-subunit alcohol dehydrogenase family)